MATRKFQPLIGIHIPTIDNPGIACYENQGIHHKNGI
jgi:hypothetical protein